jgi:hypothetical protein
MIFAEQPLASTGPAHTQIPNIFAVSPDPFDNTSGSPPKGHMSTVTSILSALEEAGIRFLDKDSEGEISIRLAH